jgi:pre-mRNA-splicing factor SYF2
MADFQTDETPKPSEAEPSTSSQTRAERFKALRARHAASTKANYAEVIAEHKRMKLDPAQLAKLDRKKAEAEMKLAKQDAEDAGEDYERKRAWDWTIEESLAWDQRLAQKHQNRDQAGFADYSQEAEKTYKLNLKGFKPDLEGYQKAKEEALSHGQLVKTENGEVVAVDDDRRFFADANSLGIMDHKPSKEAVNRLAENTKKRCVPSLDLMILTLSRLAEQEAKRRKKRAGGDDDISYINQRNKVFNQKLARYGFYSGLQWLIVCRYYDQYTRETREAFERGSGV